MIIKAIPSGPFATNAYVVACDETHLGLIIDPAPDSSKAIIHYLKDKKIIPEKIILTHSHWDHIADAAYLKKYYGIPVYVHQEDAKNLEVPGSDGLPMPLIIEGVKPDFLLNEGDEIKVGNLNLTVIHTPGHTPGGVCFYEKDASVLMSGDTLFKGSIGNVSFPTSNAKAMWKSLKKLSALPTDTTVYPGHGVRTTIGAESWLSNAEQIFGNS